MKRIGIGDIELNLLDRGSGLPLLLVHGFPLDHTMWSAQIEEFSTRFRVLAPDLRGFGASGVTTGTVTMERYADDLAALSAALSIDEPVIFCGLSMGGYVAWQFWRKHAARVKALVLCDTRSIADTPETAANRRRMREQVLAQGAAVAADAMIPKFFAAETVQQRPDLVARVRESILAAPVEGIAAALAGMAERPDAGEILPTIDVPTLVMVGEQDVISPVEEMRAIADAIPAAAWVAIPAAGHLAPLENPAVFNQSLTEFVQL